MYRFILPLLAALLAPPTQALELVSAEDAPITVYQTAEEYSFVKDLLKLAITGQGLIITNTLHISDMYERTGADLGLETKLYEKAEAFEFCSIMLSYKMSQANPANLAVCPLTIAFYQPAGEETVYVAFRNQKLLGDAAEAEKELDALLESIVHEALE